jgi:hypothetical protein
MLRIIDYKMTQLHTQKRDNYRAFGHLLLLLLLLFLTAIGFSPRGSSIAPVQTPQYNNTYINGTAQITVHVLAIHPHNTMCLH